MQNAGMAALGLNCRYFAFDVHPDSRVALSGKNLPLWDELIDISVRSSESVDLEYVGVDVVLDEKKGPMVLELNARPGLEIQVANGLGLLSMIEVE